VTLGAVFKTPFKANLRHESSFSSSIIFSENPSVNSTSSSVYVEDEHLDMPMSYGVGVSYRFSDRFTLSADIYRTEWGGFVMTDAKSNETSPITGRPMNESNIAPTHQVRIGAEYMLIKPEYVIPIRGGLFYDPAPAEGRPDNFFGFSLGGGIAYGRFIFDIAYQYRFGHDVGTSMLRSMGFSQHVAEHTVYSSIIVHF
jgi:long-subunit fatty acid transport protein